MFGTSLQSAAKLIANCSTSYLWKIVMTNLRLRLILECKFPEDKQLESLQGGCTML